MDNLHVVIMAGGVGSRFWPASREDSPKQFLDILNTGKSLIQMTWDRFAEAIPAERIYISTHEKYKGLIQEHLPDVKEENILMEPARKNTAPCLAYASMHISARNPDATMLVVPSDHKIVNKDKFLDAVTTANSFAQAHDAIMTLGMKATRPDTGYGYIRLDKEEIVKGSFDIYKALRFTEKPDRETAILFLESGDYVWNAGIFLFALRSILKAFRELSPEVIEPFEKIEEYFGTAEEREYVHKTYGDCPAISFDYAIMEKADNTYCLPAEIGWSDLGTWNSLYNELAPQDGENVHNPESEVLFKNSSGNIVILPDGKKAIMHGMDNFILIDKGDVLLIWPRDKEQEIKPLKNNIAGKWKME